MPERASSLQLERKGSILNGALPMTSSARSPLRRWARRLGVGFAALLVLGVAGEVLLRLEPGVGGSQATIATQTDLDKLIYAPDPELGATLAPSRRDRVQTLDFTYTLQTDHAGFPNPEPWPSRVDVAVLGDSLLDGPGVGMEGQFTTLLQQRLGDRTVWNFALPGGGTGHDYLIYRRYAEPLQPKLVVAVLWAEHLGAAARRDFQRFARAHRVGAAPHALQQHRLARFGEQMAAIVGGRAIDAKADFDARIAEGADRRNPRAQPAVGAGAMRDAGAGAGEQGDLSASSLTQCACQTSSPVQPSSSAYCPGRQPNRSSE